MATLNENFTTTMDSVADKITGDGSIYGKTLLTLNDLYTIMGMSARERNSAITEVSAQLAVSSTNAAISAAVEMAKSSDMIDAQVATEQERKNLVIRQTKGFDDKLLVEALKAMRAVASMEATSGTVTESVLTDLKAKIIQVETAAGITAPTA